MQCRHVHAFAHISRELAVTSHQLNECSEYQSAMPRVDRLGMFERRGCVPRIEDLVASCYGIRKVFPCKSAIGSEACRAGLINCDPIAKLPKWWSKMAMYCYKDDGILATKVVMHWLPTWRNPRWRSHNQNGRSGMVPRASSPSPMCPNLPAPRSSVPSPCARSFQTYLLPRGIRELLRSIVETRTTRAIPQHLSMTFRWLDYSPPIYVNRVRFPAGSPPDVRNRAGRRRLMADFIGYLPFPSLRIPALFHTHLTSPSLALKTLVLRAGRKATAYGALHTTIQRKATAYGALHTTIQRDKVAERLARSPPTKADRAQSPAGSTDFRKWESCRTMPLVGGFSRGSPPLVHTVFDTSWRTKAQSAPSAVTAGNQYTIDIAIFVHKTVESSLQFKTVLGDNRLGGRARKGRANKEPVWVVEGRDYPGEGGVRAERGMFERHQSYYLSLSPTHEGHVMGGPVSVGGAKADGHLQVHLVWFMAFTTRYMTSDVLTKFLTAKTSSTGSLASSVHTWPGTLQHTGLSSQRCRTVARGLRLWLVGVSTPSSCKVTTRSRGLQATQRTRDACWLQLFLSSARTDTSTSTSISTNTNTLLTLLFRLVSDILQSIMSALSYLALSTVSASRRGSSYMRAAAAWVNQRRSGLKVVRGVAASLLLLRQRLSHFVRAQKARRNALFLPSFATTNSLYRLFTKLEEKKNGGITEGFPHVGIVSDDAARWGVFSGLSPVSAALEFQRCSTLTSHSSAFKTSGTLSVDSANHNKAALAQKMFDHRKKESEQFFRKLSSRRVSQLDGGLAFLQHAPGFPDLAQALDTSTGGWVHAHFLPIRD
ncbi:hypothetical protein PR048_007459 [Dryococelus australis]|uniref:Uncharacterized protein n=1 Tax=Dryococelus australis TaxID=614101 RepID=A0ABQ9HUC5_9NEOP|nr:hypothetical protein PR048_007459 [Dryococelus australis]